MRVLLFPKKRICFEDKILAMLTLCLTFSTCSSLGQNLQTSTYIWENLFAILIAIAGLVLFAFLIGNMQVGLNIFVMLYQLYWRSRFIYQERDSDNDLEIQSTSELLQWKCWSAYDHETREGTVLLRDKMAVGQPCFGPSPLAVSLNRPVLHQAHIVSGRGGLNG